MTYRIKSISIEGYQAFQEPVHFDFLRPSGDVSLLTIIAGTNGSGKTSLLSAIYLASMLGEDLLDRGYKINLNAEAIGKVAPEVLWLGRDHPYKDTCRSLPGSKWIGEMNKAWTLLTRDGSTLKLSDTIDPFVVYAEGEEKYSFSALGAGVKSLLSMLSEIIHFGSPNILLIDSPDRDLHTQNHSLALRLLRDAAPQAQIFIATNSDDIWDRSYSWERYFLAPKGDPRASNYRRGNHVDAHQ